MTLEYTSVTRFTRICLETRIKHAPINKNIIAETTQRKRTFKKTNPSGIIDNKKFWKTVSPLFGNKVKTNNKINLIEKIFYQHLVKRLLKHLESILMKSRQSST